MLDVSYEGYALARKGKELHGADIEIVKRSELPGFHVMPKRWVVERSFAWLDKYRRLWRNCERKLDISLQMLIATFDAILINRF